MYVLRHSARALSLWRAPRNLESSDTDGGLQCRHAIDDRRSRHVDSTAWRAVSKFSPARRDALGCLELVTTVTVQLCDDTHSFQPNRNSLTTVVTRTTVYCLAGSRAHKCSRLGAKRHRCCLRPRLLLRWKRELALSPPGAIGDPATAVGGLGVDATLQQPAAMLHQSRLNLLQRHRKSNQNRSE